MGEKVRNRCGKLRGRSWVRIPQSTWPRSCTITSS